MGHPLFGGAGGARGILREAWLANVILRWSGRVHSGDGRLCICCAGGPGSRCSMRGVREIRGRRPAGDADYPRGLWPDGAYTKLAQRALALWKQHEARWKRQFFFPIGVLWMAQRDDAYERASVSALQDAGIGFEQLAVKELGRRWPQINFEDVEWGIFEPGSGYLLARAATQAVVEQFIAEGGEYRQAAVAAEDLEGGEWKALALSFGSHAKGATLAADGYVFACGPWLGKMFPRTVGPHFISTKQELFFFGTPAGDAGYDEGSLPVWGDHAERFMYGIPGKQGRGFKMADDTRGPEFDPTAGQRLASDEGWRRRGATWRTAFRG